MGGCLGTRRPRMNHGRSAVNDNLSDISSRRSSDGGFVTLSITRKNHPLCHEPVRWKSDVPLTEGQLKSKRDEFWDTAPAFEGKCEIWDALRAAASAFEAADFQLAQAIIDGASISVPNGYLTECYDELGTRYQVPVYCLSYPINIVKDGCGRESPTCETTIKGVDIVLKVRLSTNCQDIKLPVLTSDSVATAKRKLQVQTGIDPIHQRWFYAGKLLGDKILIDEARISAGYIIQVIVNSETFGGGNV